MGSTCFLCWETFALCMFIALLNRIVAWAIETPGVFHWISIRVASKAMSNIMTVAQQSTARRVSI